MFKFITKCLLLVSVSIGIALLLKNIVIYKESNDEIDAPLDYEKQYKGECIVWNINLVYMQFLTRIIII